MKLSFIRDTEKHTSSFGVFHPPMVVYRMGATSRGETGPASGGLPPEPLPLEARTANFVGLTSTEAMIHVAAGQPIRRRHKLISTPASTLPFRGV